MNLLFQEVELQARRDQFRMEELRQQHLLEKRQLPKKLKAEHKVQVAELRKAIRSKKVENSKDRFKKVREENPTQLCPGFSKLHSPSPYTQMDEQYVKRSQLETELMNERHDKELETVKAELEGNMRELHEIQVNSCGGRGMLPEPHLLHAYSSRSFDHPPVHCQVYV